MYCLNNPKNKLVCSTNCSVNNYTNNTNTRKKFLVQLGKSFHITHCVTRTLHISNTLHCLVLGLDQSYTYQVL